MLNNEVDVSAGQHDLSIDPPRYVEPPTEECDLTEYPLEIQPGVIIFVKQLEQNRQLRMFSLHMSAVIDGVREDISRIDTKHGEVHQHFYRRGSYDPDRPKLVFSAIPVDNPEAHLDRAWEMAFELLVDDADVLIRRWH